MNRTWVALAAGIVLGSAGPAFAKATWLKKAQAADPRIEGCTSCHLTKKGKDLNARGQWLMNKKQEMGVKDIDFQWLKEYVEAAEPPPAAGDSKPEESEKPASEEKPADAKP